MKFRKGFVTNSSSSSYICDICGSVESGYDCSADDLGMYACSAGHVICQSHVAEITIEKEDLIAEIEDSVLNYTNLLKNCADNFKKRYEERLADVKKDLEDAKVIDADTKEFEELCDDYELGYQIPISKCPICNMDQIAQDDIEAYVYKKFDINVSKIEKEIKDSFASYKEFKTYLKGK